MDTKMKLPPLRERMIDAAYQEWGAAGSYDTLTREQAAEVISRCNAAPKLVEALKREMGWAQHNGDIRAIERIQAILKETGAEK